MVNINHLIISGVLAIVLANYVFPRIIYLMCEMILWIDQVISLSEDEMQDWTNCLLVRGMFLILFLASWVMMLVVFVPMQLLAFIEVFGGFVNEEI